MSARYFRLGPSFWSDPAMRTVSDDAKLLAFYLLTSPHRTTEGLFRLPRAYAIADLGWSAERFAQPFEELLAAGFAEYDEGAQVCLIVKALRWQAPANDNVAKAAIDRIAELPATPLLARFYGLTEQFCPERLPKRLRERFGEQLGEPLALSQSLSQSLSPSAASNGTTEERVAEAEEDAVIALRDQIVAAFEQADEPSVRRLGWWSAFEAAREWWSPRQTCTAREFVPYVKLLADEDPARVLEAFRELAGEWRPHPSAVRAHIHRQDIAARIDVGRARDRAAEPDAIAAVAAAHQAGEGVCSCDHHRPNWRRDHRWVLRCCACGGLEPGQVYAIEDQAAA